MSKERFQKFQKLLISEVRTIRMNIKRNSWRKINCKRNGTFSYSRYWTSLQWRLIRRKIITKRLIDPLQDPVTWYGINYAGTQVTQWDFQNKGKSGWTGTSSFVLEVPLRNLRPSIINSVPCDRILQRVY